MTALLTALTAKAAPYLIGGGAVFIIWLLTILKAVLWGASREREKQAAEEARARDIRDQVDNDVGSLPADAARKELGKWAR